MKNGFIINHSAESLKYHWKYCISKKARNSLAKADKTKQEIIKSNKTQSEAKGETRYSIDEMTPLNSLNLSRIGDMSYPLKRKISIRSEKGQKRIKFPPHVLNTEDKCFRTPTTDPVQILRKRCIANNILSNFNNLFNICQKMSNREISEKEVAEILVKFEGRAKETIKYFSS